MADAKTLNLLVEDISWKDWSAGNVDWVGMWNTFLDSGDDDLHQYLVEGQSEVVSLAAVPLTPILIAFARSQLPHRHKALGVLASILSSRGPLEYEQQQAGFGPVSNPFQPGTMLDHPASPDPSDLEDEARLIHDMKQEIEAAIEDWKELATASSPQLSLAALGLLAEIIHLPQMELAEQTIESVFESANQDRRDELWYVMERMEMAKRCSFCVSLET